MGGQGEPTGRGGAKSRRLAAGQGVSANFVKNSKAWAFAASRTKTFSANRETVMFTIIAIIAAGALAFWSDRQTTREVIQRPAVFDDELVRQSVVFARQELRLISWVLASILVMLGIIADRIH
jgi:hypothetical protein